MIAAVALYGIFAAARATDALLCAAVGTDLGHGYRGILGNNRAVAKEICGCFAVETCRGTSLLLRPQYHHKTIPLHPHIHFHFRFIF